MNLPLLNACLNVTAAALLSAGWLAVKRRRLALHKACMLSATAVSTLFLASYLLHHYRVGHVVFQGTGSMRTFYLSILGTHTVLAAAVPFLAGITLWRALKGDFERHKRIARWTLPIWLYVSVTGVIVYAMLYSR